MNQSVVIAGIISIFLVVCVLFESVILTLFKIDRFSRSLCQATLVNVVSVVAIYFIWPFVSRLDVDEDKVFPLLPILLGVIIVVEALLLKALNRQQTWLRIFIAGAVMNTVSVAILYLLLLFL